MVGWRVREAAWGAYIARLRLMEAFFLENRLLEAHERDFFWKIAFLRLKKATPYDHGRSSIFKTPIPLACPSLS